MGTMNVSTCCHHLWRSTFGLIPWSIEIRQLTICFTSHNDGWVHVTGRFVHQESANQDSTYSSHVSRLCLNPLYLDQWIGLSSRENLQTKTWFAHGFHLQDLQSSPKPNLGLALAQASVIFSKSFLAGPQALRHAPQRSEHHGGLQHDGSSGMRSQ